MSSNFSFKLWQSIGKWKGKVLFQDLNRIKIYNLGRLKCLQAIFLRCNMEYLNSSFSNGKRYGRKCHRLHDVWLWVKGATSTWDVLKILRPILISWLTKYNFKKQVQPYAPIQLIEHLLMLGIKWMHEYRTPSPKFWGSWVVSQVKYFMGFLTTKAMYLQRNSRLTTLT